MDRNLQLIHLEAKVELGACHPGQNSSSRRDNFSIFRSLQTGWWSLGEKVTGEFKQQMAGLCFLQASFRAMIVFRGVCWSCTLNLDRIIVFPYLYNYWRVS